LYMYAHIKLGKMACEHRQILLFSFNMSFLFRIGVHSTFVYIYAVVRVLMIWANCFFLLTCLFFLEKQKM